MAATPESCVAGLAANGASILVAEQKTDLLAGICSRVVALDGGRVVLDGIAAEILADARLTRLGVAPPAAVRLRRAAAEANLPAKALARLEKALAPTSPR